ncbi:MAG: DNA polymerase III subunit delta [Mollicutes bacterium]|nr:DNA polymerase III subunit delta [Mollicutes bacterium]
MKNIYVVYGNEKYLIESSLNKIIENNHDSEIVKYDLNFDLVNNIIEEIISFPLFADKKIIVISNALFLTGLSNNISDEEIKALEKVLEDIPEQINLVLVVENEKLDGRKNLVKKLLKDSNILECNKLSDQEAYEFVKNTFEEDNYQIDLKAINSLLDKSKENLTLLMSEIDKLKIFKVDTKIITKEDVDQLVSKYDYDNIFELTNSVVNKDLTKALFLYQELLKRGEEPIKIIVLLANQFRTIFQVKKMLINTNNNKEIADKLKIHPYRVELAKRINISEEMLLDYLEKLADLDENIKTNRVDKESGLEMFFLNM